MSAADEATSPPAPIGTAAAAVAGFLGLFHFIGNETWGHGKETFPRMLGLAAIVLAAPYVGRYERRVGTPRVLGLVLLAWSALLGQRLYGELRVALDRSDLTTVAIDIARNTYEAGTQFLAGHDMYIERCQLGHEVTAGPHVTVDADGVRMYGLRYTYGFPYFPAMMLAYLPFRQGFAGLHAIRVGNAVYLLLGTIGVAWLAARSVRRGERTLAAGLGTVAYLAIDVLAPEHFRLAVTDVCIAAFAVFAYLAVSYDRAVLAGVLLGVAQGARLLPGPLLVLPAIAYLATRRKRTELGVAYVLTSLAFVLPALVRAPEAFVSSTIAFYLTYHGVGDDTSLYWFLPEWLKAPFLAAGFVLAAGFALIGFRRPARSIGEASGQAFLAYFLFTAFNRMTHLNYLWGIHTLGAVAVASGALATVAPRLSPRRPARPPV